MTEPTPKTRTLTSSWYTTSQACGPAGTSQQRPLTRMRSFITEGSETKVHACSWSNRSRCQRAFAPVFEIVGNGCKFRRTADAIRAVAPGLFEGLDIDEFLAPVPIPFLRPHIIAKATRAAS